MPHDAPRERWPGRAADAPAVVVGGNGGSGTRVVAALLQAGGLHLGDDLNAAHDNLWATLLFKRAGLMSTPDERVAGDIALLSRAMTGAGPADAAQRARLEALAMHDRPQHSVGWLRQRVEHLLAACARPRPATIWGWKEPNSHMLLPWLRAMPGVRYIHVVRDGLYMAHSRNRNQHACWGELLTGEAPEPSPRYALKYWCAVQRRAEAHVEAMGPRALLLDYDALCARPAEGIARLNAFLDGLGIVVPPSAADGIAVKPPPPDDTEGLDADDVACALDWRHRRWIPGAATRA